MKIDKAALVQDFNAGLTLWDLADKYNRTVYTIRRILKSEGFEFTNLIDMTGQQCGEWTVLCRSHDTDKSNDAFWWCRCKCGLEKSVKGSYLRSGESKQCVSCSLRNRRTYEDLPLKYWANLKKNADKRNITIEIVPEDVIKCFQQQNSKCVITGLPISFNDGTASVDRKDSSLSYTKENIQIVHKEINYMKHTLTEERFFELCNLVTQGQKTQ